MKITQQEIEDLTDYLRAEFEAVSDGSDSPEFAAQIVTAHILHLFKVKE